MLSGQCKLTGQSEGKHIYNLPPHVLVALLFLSQILPSLSAQTPAILSPTQSRSEKCGFLTDTGDRVLTVCPLCLSGICQLSSVCLNPSDPPDPQRPSSPIQ